MCGCDLGKQTSHSERRDDAVHHARQLVERGNHRLAMDNLHLAERYFQANLWLHIHLRHRALGSLVPVDFCAFLYGAVRFSPAEFNCHRRDSSGPLREKHFAKAPGHINNEANRRPVCRNQQFVLIGNVEQMEHPEQFIPALVWFDRLENVHRSLTPALGYSTVLGFERLNTVVDGESGLITQVISDVHHIPPQNVQRGAKVVRGITRDRTKARREGLVDMSAKYPVPRLRLDLASEFIRVAFCEGLDFGFEIVDVLFGPFDLEPTAGFPIGHD